MTDWNASDVEEVLPVLRRYARTLTKNAGEADDLVQDTLLRAYERSDSFTPGLSLSSWLLSILHNRFVDDERRRDIERTHRAGAGEADTHCFDPPDSETSVYLKQVAERFASLPHQHRSVLHLVAVEGMSYAQAAATLGVPIGTVMSRLARAREALRRCARPSADARKLRIVGGSDER